MATTKKILVEQALRRIKAGNPSAGSNVHPAEVEKALEGVINGYLRPRFFETMAGQESIPEGCVVVSYTGVKVMPYQGVSQCFLPAIPASLPKNMGVWHIAPGESVPDELPAPEIYLTLVTANSITVVIVPVKGAVSYVVQQSLNRVNWQTIGTEAKTYLRSGLSPVTKYYFRVMTIADGITHTNGGWANADATTLSAIITLPASVLTAVAVGGTEIDLTWTAVANRTGYLLERSTDNATWVSIYTGTALSFNDTGRLASTQYFYRLTATGDNLTYGNSPYATADATTPANLPQLTAPQNISVQFFSSSIAFFDWNDVTNATSYVWEIATANTFGAAVVANDAATTSDAIANTNPQFQPGSVFYFRCRSMASGYQPSPWSAVFTFGGTQIAVPVITFSNVTTNSLRVNWTPDTRANSSLAGIYLDSAFQNSVATAGGSNSGQANFSSLTSGTTYYFRVRQSDSYGWYLQSNYGTAQRTLP